MTTLNTYKQKVLDYLGERDSKQDLTKEELQQVLNFSDYKIKRFLKEATSAGFISIMTFETGGIKRTSLMVNPFYVSDKEYIDLMEYRAFETDNIFKECLQEHSDKLKSEAVKEIEYNEYLLRGEDTK